MSNVGADYSLANQNAAERETMVAQLAAKDALIGNLMTAIGWLIPPFVDENTSKKELLQRIKFCVADADRAMKAANPPED